MSCERKLFNDKRSGIGNLSSKRRKRKTISFFSFYRVSQHLMKLLFEKHEKNRMRVQETRNTKEKHIHLEEFILNASQKKDQ